MKFISGMVVAFVLLVQPLLLQGQANTGFNRFSLGINGGVLTPFTDIEQRDYFRVLDEFSFAGGVNAEYHFTPVFTIRGSFLLGQLKANDENQNINFNSELWEANVSGMLSLSKLLSPRWRRNDRIDIYGILGVGVVAYRSKYFDSLNDELIKSYGYSEDGSEKEKRLADLAVPLGLGVRFYLSPRIDLAFESVYRFTQTDKLDALHRYDTRYDTYNYTKLGLIFKLGKNSRSMKWASPSVVMYPGDTHRMEFITERITEVDRRVDQIDQRLEQTTYDQDIAQLRQQIQAIDQKQNDLNSRMSSLADAKPASYLSESSMAALLSVYFRLNSSAIDNYNYERIASAARFMAANPDVRIELVGHTDITGPSAYNVSLSESRAQAVYDVLVNDFKIDPERLAISFRGPNDPLSQQNLSINRRVDFIILND
ncbi:MAG: OmpA family protein [Bacteroides sp.]|jgi:OOP family OmpA-OmpF porin|nr:OmpA family protein [Bacteroides sp.]